MIEFIPNRPFVDALAQARRDAEAWDVLRSTDARKETRWAEWAGNELEAMMRSPDRTIEHLKSANPKLRLAAIALTVDYWPHRESFAAPCLKLAFEDAESPIRGAALMGLLMLQMYISDSTGWLKRLLDALYGRLSEQDKASARQTLDEGWASIQQFHRETMKRLAGAELDNMLQSRTAAESFLCSPDPKIRYAALFVVAHHWGLTKEFADRCEDLVRNDPDTKVRIGALTKLGTFYSQSDDRRMGNILARIVYDAGQPIDLRTHAYRLLFLLRGMPLAVKEKVWSPEFRFPEEVDWAFVESFVQERAGDVGVNS
jgi:hypothetical protein